MNVNATAYADLMAYQRQTEALAQVAGRLGWDQETQMPRGAAEQRSEEMAALEGILHARRTDPRLADWLAQAEAADDTAAAQLRLIRRSHTRMMKIPARLAEELARVTSMAQGVWAQARADIRQPFAPLISVSTRSSSSVAQPSAASASTLAVSHRKRCCMLQRLWMRRQRLVATASCMQSLRYHSTRCAPTKTRLLAN